MSPSQHDGPVFLLCQQAPPHIRQRPLAVSSVFSLNKNKPFQKRKVCTFLSPRGRLLTAWREIDFSSLCSIHQERKRKKRYVAAKKRGRVNLCCFLPFLVDAVSSLVKGAKCHPGCPSLSSEGKYVEQLDGVRRKNIDQEKARAQLHHPAQWAQWCFESDRKNAPAVLRKERQRQRQRPRSRLVWRPT